MKYFLQFCFAFTFSIQFSFSQTEPIKFQENSQYYYESNNNDNSLLEKKYDLFNIDDSLLNIHSGIENTISNNKDSLKQTINKLSHPISSDSLHKVDSLRKIVEKIGLDSDYPQLPGISKIELQEPGFHIPEIPKNDTDALPVKPGQIQNPFDKMGLNNLNNMGSVDGFVEGQAVNINGIAELKNQAGGIDQNVNNLVNPMGDLNELNPENKMPTISNQKAMEKIKELLNTKPEVFEEAQDRLNSLKKKYSYVPNSNDLSESEKINSLKKGTLKDRIVVGTNFKFNQGNPLIFDFAPLLLYKFNMDFHAGLSGSYTATINYDEKIQNANPTDIIGISAVIRYFVLKGFYAYSEAGYKSSKYTLSLQNWENLNSREWVPGWNLGIGKQMSLTNKLNGQIILTYDFLYSDKSFSKSPWSIKIGFDLDNLNFKKPKEPSK